MEIKSMIRREPKEVPVQTTHTELREILREKHQVEKWFNVRADNFIRSAARGLFTKTIQAEHLKAEFKAIARALGGEGKVLEDWFELRAEVFVEKVAKGAKLGVKEVREEFGHLARDYHEIRDRFEKSMLRGAEQPAKKELQDLRQR